MVRRRKRRTTPKSIAASRLNLVKARAALAGKKLTPSQRHGSGTGLTSAWRYTRSALKSRGNVDYN